VFGDRRIYLIVWFVSRQWDRLPFEYFGSLLLTAILPLIPLHPLIYYLPTPWSRVLLETLTGFQLVKKFPAFYGTRMFITAFTSDRYFSISGASSIQSVPPHPTSWRAILILSSHLQLGLPSGLFPSSFPTKTLYTPLLSIRAICPAHPILLDFITRKILFVNLLPTLYNLLPTLYNLLPTLYNLLPTLYNLSY